MVRWVYPCGCVIIILPEKMFGRIVHNVTAPCLQHRNTWEGSVRKITTPLHPKEYGAKKMLTKYVDIFGCKMEQLKKPDMGSNPNTRKLRICEKEFEIPFLTLAVMGGYLMNDTPGIIPLEETTGDYLLWCIVGDDKKPRWLIMISFDNGERQYSTLQDQSKIKDWLAANLMK